MRKLLLLCACLAVVGCGVQTRKPSKATAQDAVSKLTYVRSAETGECFAVTSTSEFGQVNDQSATITWVPCSPRVLSQVSK